MSTILSNMDWSPVLALLGTIITGLLGWLAKWIAAKNKADEAKSKAESALFKLAAIGSSLLQKGWTTIGPDLQAALADGKITAEERALIEVKVAALLKDATDADTLKEIADALGLPLAGVVAKIAATLIETWTRAHDPAVPAESKLTYPVQDSPLGNMGG